MAGAGRTFGSLLCALALAGCSGTRFGDQLARSFSAPPAQPAQPVSPAPNPATATPASKTASPTAASPKKVEPKPVEAKPPAVNPSKPAPYRITIQLPSADPAAPAEAVTQALRAAGVSFEVEMIERVGAAAIPAAAPTVTPAPAPR
ncbi:MAG: hypothetical protein NWQ25_02875 [Prochlorococcaceae cyanobacterium MAG_34]|jgi:hypothetical protein|uniref:hypothetical protein n=1 Tax=Cyanobium sp. TaxID=2164130 RepID=UPI00274EAF48|nr:hypothetical protein [Cyanobium sp. MAG_255]MDP4736629.1 hypothetical protein [Cyanobium sp. MAG_216]MDP4808182.1 hypothetical protein [Cyanobium sp. MAG_160]MDP4830171.1 hypothetical protein [Cyanobium sp. MAG_185]MDP4880673.1 hypothetical protein [Cyanobium sp. MAG_137]MDP4947102.1 hypothetical protein [Cyanobium sp. MAG_102]MDP5118314.1 hypothetical protein [Prochlorococcaceae cyanobacterium MAG_34]